MNIISTIITFGMDAVTTPPIPDVSLPAWAVSVVVSALVAALVYITNKYTGSNNKINHILENHAATIKEMAAQHAAEITQITKQHHIDMTAIIEKTTIALVRVTDVTESHTDVLKEMTQLIRELKN